MKKSFVRSLLLLALMAAVLCLLVACGGDDPDDTTAPETSAPATSAPATSAPATSAPATSAPATSAPTTQAPATSAPAQVNGYTPNIGDFVITAPSAEALAGYKIVHAETASDDVIALCNELVAAIEAKTGVALPVVSDYLGLNGTLPTDAKEIRVGITNRDAGYGWLRAKDYRIEKIGDSLAILAVTDDTLETAVNAYTSLMMTSGVGMPDKAYWYQAEYPVENLFFGGVDVSKFTIVRDTENAAVAEYLRARITELTGYVLPVRTATMPEATYEIVIGNIARAGIAYPEAGTYLIKLQGTKLVLGGTGSYAGYYATLAFLDTIEAGTQTGATLAVPVPTKEVEHRMGGLFTLNLPDALPSMAGLYDITMSADAVLDRFLAAKAQLPEKVTVLETFKIEDYPFSMNLEIYVSPNGDDNNPGTKEAPVKTLPGALQKVQNRNGGIIWMMGGTYSTDTTITVTGAHGGLATSPLFIKAYNDEEVIITSMKTLDTAEEKWDYIDPADPLHAGIIDRIKEDALPNIIYTTLDLQGWRPEDIPAITKSGPGRLFLNNVEYSLAQYPNAEDCKTPTELLYFTHAYDSGKVTAKEGSDRYWPWVALCGGNGWNITDEHGWEIRVLNGKDNVNNAKAAYNHPYAAEKGEEITSWVNTGDIWYYGSTFEGWEFGYYNLALTTTEHGVTKHWAHTKSGAAWTPTSGETPYLGTPKAGGYYSLKSMTYNSWGCKVSGNSSAGRNTYFLFNAIEALDAPGEWYYEKETGALYIYQKDEDLDLAAARPAFSNPASFNTVTVTSAQNVILDGLTFNGASKIALYVTNSDSIIVQNCTFTNTMSQNVSLSACLNCAVIYSDFSMAYATMLSVSDNGASYGLYPSNNVIQNNVFHDPAPYMQCAVGPGGCRVVVSHNYFNNTNLQGGGIEGIIEYNLFEGGSKDITDGGFIYPGGIGNRGNHIRYNLVHMFNATHNAVYNDTMSSGNYMYYNVVSTLHSTADHNKPWYSSTGWGNVSYGNVTVLRTPAELRDAGSNATVETEGYAKATEGDVFNESGLFYYHFGEEYSAGGTAGYYTPLDYDGNMQWPVEEYEDGKYRFMITQYTSSRKDQTKGTTNAYLGQSLAGHWWDGYKQGDYKRYLGYNNSYPVNVELWKDRMPEYINMYYGTEIIMNLKDAVGRGEEDYHIKYFYVPWFLTYDEDGSRKTFTYRVSDEAVIQIPEYSYLEKTGEGQNDFTVVTVPDHIHTERNEDGSITLTYEEIAAMERARRAPMYSVVMNNVVLGSSPKYVRDSYGSNVYPIDENSIPSVVTQTCVPVATLQKEVGGRGFVPTTYVGYNFMRYDYRDIMPEAYYFYYNITDEGWDMIADTYDDPSLTIQPGEVETLKKLIEGIYGEAEITVGPRDKSFDPLDYFHLVYPDFVEKDEDEYFYWTEEIRYDLMD